jgi:hypothetical protein
MLVLNPPDDDDFDAYVRTVADDGVRRPDQLEARIRRRYPRAVVRRRELVGERVDVWYVYRDGHWIRSPLV